MTPYEVILGPAAKLFVLSMRHEEARETLAKSLREELDNGPNAAVAFPFSLEHRVSYTALPLTSGGIVAVYRPMTDVELKRVEVQRTRQVAKKGFFVADLLTPESGFYLRIAVRV